MDFEGSQMETMKVWGNDKELMLKWFYSAAVKTNENIWKMK